MPSNTVRGPRKPARARSAARMPGLRRPAGMQPLGPGAFGEILDDAARHASGNAERIDDLAAGMSPNAARDAGRRAHRRRTPRSGESRPCACAFGATRLSRHITSTPTAIPSSAAAPSGLIALASGEHRRHDHRAGMHRTTLEGVVEILAMRGGAVDEGGARRAQPRARGRWRCRGRHRPSRRARRECSPRVGPSRKDRPRRPASPRTCARNGRRQGVRRRAHAMRAARCCATETSGRVCSKAIAINCFAAGTRRR